MTQHRDHTPTSLAFPRAGASGVADRPPEPHMPPWAVVLLEKLDRIDQQLALSVEKEAYTTEEVAERVGRTEWTVRQWCNKGQVRGAYKVRGRGRTGEWRIPHEAVVRLQSEGPLPPENSRAA